MNMNIYKQFLYRHCLWDEYLEEIEKIASKIWTYDEYDEYLNKEIEKMPQIQFINWILNEIELIFKNLNWKKLIFSNWVIDKLSLIKISIFDIYLSNHINKIDSLDVKIKLLDLYNILITLYNINSTSDRIKLFELNELKRKFLD